MWAAEFGSYEPVPIGRDQIADSLRIVFEAGADDLDGFFPFDPPGASGSPSGSPIWKPPCETASPTWPTESDESALAEVSTDLRG